MTRYARAKGSKASNERVEEEATPWEEMKAQITPLMKKKSPIDVEALEDDLDIEDQINDEAIEDVEANKDSEEVEEVKDKIVDKLVDASDLKKAKRKRSQNKCLNCKLIGHLKRECPELSEERRKELQDLVQMKIERKGQGTGRKKSKNKRKLAENLEGQTEEVHTQQSAKRAKITDENGKKPDNRMKAKITNENDKKVDNGKNKDHKKVLKDKTGQIVQDGEGLFQGFRVLQSDVQRLRDLHAKLVKEKIPTLEIKEALKKERRKAERALANSKKNVCFQCRQPGHLVNDCPKVRVGNKAVQKMGKCFKCGSEDHTSKKCQSKLKGGDAYKFADCFVCGQAGHLAKACPDNPKGLYPKGGGCRFCGSVEHLKSECPRKAQKDARTEIRAERQTDLTSIEEEAMDRVVKKPSVAKKAKKVVNF